MKTAPTNADKYAAIARLETTARHVIEDRYSAGIMGDETYAGAIRFNVRKLSENKRLSADLADTVSDLLYAAYQLGRLHG